MWCLGGACQLMRHSSQYSPCSCLAGHLSLASVKCTWDVYLHYNTIQENNQVIENIVAYSLPNVSLKVYLRNSQYTIHAPCSCVCQCTPHQIPVAISMDIVLILRIRNVHLQSSKMFVPAHCTCFNVRSVIEIKSLTVILPIDPICFFILILFFQHFSFFLFHFESCLIFLCK